AALTTKRRSSCPHSSGLRPASPKVAWSSMRRRSVSAICGSRPFIVETLDASEGKGYQRLLNETRAKRPADYLLDAHTSPEAFLPTSVFLATDKVTHGRLLSIGGRHLWFPAFRSASPSRSRPKRTLHSYCMTT